VRGREGGREGVSHGVINEYIPKKAMTHRSKAQSRSMWRDTTRTVWWWSGVGGSGCSTPQPATLPLICALTTLVSFTHFCVWIWCGGGRREGGRKQTRMEFAWVGCAPRTSRPLCTPARAALRCRSAWTDATYYHKVVVVVTVVGGWFWCRRILLRRLLLPLATRPRHARPTHPASPPRPRRLEPSPILDCVPCEIVLWQKP
jgi:hypothetical protein